MKEINMRTVLEECLDYENGLKRLCSKKYDGVMPMDGMEDVFREQEEKCAILRRLLQAIKNAKVRDVIANWENLQDEKPKELKDWQKKIMEGQGLTTEDISPAEEPMRF